MTGETFRDKHLTNEGIRFYLKLKDSRLKNVSIEDKKSFNEIEEHVCICPKCSSNIYLVQSMYHKEVKKYRTRKQIRRGVGVTAVVILLLIIFNPFSRDVTIEHQTRLAESVKKAADSLIVSDTVKYDLSDKEEIKGKDALASTKDDAVKMPNEIEKMAELLREYEMAQKRIENLTLLAYSAEKQYNLPNTFKDDPIQEGIVKSMIRSPFDINIQSPKNLSIHKMPITFVWAQTIGEVTIVIKNNKNKKVWEKSISDGRTIICNKDLEPGTYYWDFRVDKILKGKYKFYITP